MWQLEALEKNRQEVRHIKENIPEERSIDGWGIWYSRISWYSEDFSILFSEVSGYRDKLGDCIEDEFKEKRGNVVGIELGGPGVKLFYTWFYV